MSEIDSEKDKAPGLNAAAQPDKSGEDDARPLTGEPVAPMRLRAEPPRVTRLSRKVLAGLGIAAGVGIGGALIYALQTQHSNKTGEELYSTDNRSTPDGLASLPKDYAGVPRLGPPLPGDLGRPILNAQNNGKPVPVPGIGAPGGAPPRSERRGTTPSPGVGRCAHRSALRLDRYAAGEHQFSAIGGGDHAADRSRQSWLGAAAGDAVGAGPPARLPQSDAR